MLLGLTTVPPGVADGRAWRIDCSPDQEYHWVSSFHQSKAACFRQEARGGWCSSQGLLRFHMLWRVPPVCDVSPCRLGSASLHGLRWLPGAVVCRGPSVVREESSSTPFQFWPICLGVCWFPPLPPPPPPTFLLDVLRL